MAENAGFLSLSFLKKERETVLNKFPPNLQNLAENNSLHGCLIFYVHVISAVWPLQKHKKSLQRFELHVYYSEENSYKLGQLESC